MPKILWKATYSVEGAKGVLREGGTGRRAAVEKAVASAGGTLESFYYAFGEDDVYVIADLPSNVDVAALALGVGAAGGARVTTSILMTPEEVDQAAKKAVEYRPPGG